jgi:hypothetical protein
MKGLTKFLVEAILGEADKINKTIVVYSGRFQPFHKGHYATYDHLVKKFGKDNVYIGTSDVTDSKKSPFAFKEKKAIMMKMFGIPSNKIVNVRNPYAPEEILNKFNSDTTGFITVVGEKDSSRLSGKYFTPYKGKVDIGYLDRGYVYAAPAQPNAISGTDVRYWLSSGSDAERKKNFTKAYPKFDDQVFKMITLKLKKLKECINEEIKLNVKVGDQILMGKFKNKKVVVKSIGEDEWGMPTINGKKAVTFRIPKKDIKEGLGGGAGVGLSLPGGYINGAPNPKDVKKLKSKLDGDGSEEYTKVKEITTVKNHTPVDIDGADDNFNKHHKGGMYTPDWGYEAELDTIDFDDDRKKEVGHQANTKDTQNKGYEPVKEDQIPGGLAKGMSLKDIAKHHKISPQTLKNEFIKGYAVEREHTTDVNIAKEIALDHLYEDPNYYSKLSKIETPMSEALILEGGAYGHMAHPFDIEMGLTFGDLKQIVVRALNGDLELAREKTDGQALAISWVNGRLVAARNKSHLKNKGAGAMTIGQVADKFAGRGGLTDAYNFAMSDLSKAIGALSEPQRKMIFKGGSCFMNLEVIYPTSVNVIPYGQPLLVFHGTFEYDKDGNIIGENQQAARILAGMIKQVNGHVQSKYTIQGPPMQKLPKSENLSKLQGKYISMISRLQSEFGLSDSDGVADYHQAWWTKFVEKGAKKLDTQEKIGLVKRWAFGDKSFRIATIQDAKLRAWAEQTDKQDQQKISKQNLMKFEEIFLGVGADVLSFMSSVLTANPESAKRQMVAKLESTIKQVKASGDPKKIEKLKLELERLNALGGFDKIVPNEGIVFVYGRNTYKLTGAFAPLNQILGIFF